MKIDRLTLEDKMILMQTLGKGDRESMKKKKAIAEKYGVSYKTIKDNWKNKIREEMKDFELNKDNLYVKGVSTLVDAEGNTKIQWIKEDTDKKKRDLAILASIERLVSSVPAKDEISLSSEKEEGLDSDILVKYPIADAHLGLLTWHKEVGVDWDISLATKYFKRGFKMLLDSSPNSEYCLILDLGDLLHTDDSTNQTKASGHRLDVDGRFDKVFDAALVILTSMIDMALEKHDTVIFRKSRGNHDGDVSVAIGAFLEAYYRNNPRVKIARSPDLFWYFKFGKTLHYSTHGHTVKQKDLGEIVAADCRGIWSEVDFVYCDTGHVHHQQILETRTCICESHNSLAPGDSYNYGHGYRSGRNLKSITYHRYYGEIGRSVVNTNRIDKEL
jgi:hypothetical protein